jgi:hypothetical protein
MNHRHLDVPPGTSVEDLPLAAVHDLLERGDLESWRPLLRSIAAEPFGQTARAVERLIDVYPIYGTSRLFRDWIARCRHRRSAAQPSAEPAVTLHELRGALGLTQREVAARMGLTQSDYSKLERRSDVRVSTLRRAATALGGRLVLAVEFDGRLARVDLPSDRAPLGTPTA